MTAIVSPAVRSRMMARIRSRDTKPELLVRRYLHGAGFRFRLARKDLPGTPDLLLPRYNAAIFVHGCYWHGHLGCRYATTPATRTEFWRAKIDANSRRDTRAKRDLEDLGWRVAVIWECALRKQFEVSLKRLERFLLSADSQIDISTLL